MIELKFRYGYSHMYDLYYKGDPHDTLKGLPDAFWSMSLLLQCSVIQFVPV